MKRRIWIGTGVLLVATWVIILHADDLSMWFDELWSMFQYTRDLEHVLRERELNWPPAYALTLYSWVHLIGPNDFVVHMLGALIGLLGAAFAIRAGRELDSDRAGWLAGLAFGTSSYAVYFVLEARGYGLLLAASMALVTFHARWTKHPTWGRAVPYVLVQILVLYTQFAGVIIVGLTAIRVALVVPVRWWRRWIAIMLVTGAAFLPILPQFIRSYRVRGKAISGDLPGYFLTGPGTLYRAYSAHQDVLWAAILILSAIGLGLWLWRGSREKRATVIWLAVWGLAMPVFAYLTRSETALYTSRYLVFTLPGGLLLVAIGLARLPRRVWMVGGALLLVYVMVPWRPFDHRPDYSDSPPVRDLVRVLADRWQPGDVLVLDPVISGTGYDWWYYEPLYFQGGHIPRADGGHDAGRRVWHLVRQGSDDPTITSSVKEGRIATDFWGPWYFALTLYEGPPQTPGIALGHDPHFRGAVIPGGEMYMPGDTLTVQTWWSVDAPLPADYSIGLHLVGPDGSLIAQSDSGPVGPYTPDATSAWKPEQVYRDDRTIQIPWCLKASTGYELRLVVYQWWDGVPLIPDASAQPAPDGGLLLDTLSIESFSYCK